MPTGVGLQVAREPSDDVPSFVADVARRVGADLDLNGTLDRVVDGAVELLGFGVACLNLRQPAGHLEVVTVTGPQEARDALLGTRSTPEEWEGLFAAAESLGGLRFLPFDSAALDPSEVGVSRWVPTGLRLVGPESWHPGDELFAPLHDSQGELLGVLSVDAPPGGRRPDARLCELLELFAVQAALAVEHARLHERQSRNAELLRLTFAQSPVGMAVFSPDGRLSQANAAYCAFFGLTETDLLGTPLRELTHPKGAPQSTPGAVSVDRRYSRADGHGVWGRLTLTPLDSGHVLAQLEDATAVRDVERRASTDSLTGLDNRAAVLERLGALLRQGPTAVLYCDVDNFKVVNDSLGHAAGDDLLVEIARNLYAVLRPGDQAGRLGGDEFVVVLPGGLAAVALEVAERVRKASRRVLTLGESTVMTSMTVGVAIGVGCSAEELLGEADRALLSAKRQGRDRVVLA